VVAGLATGESITNPDKKLTDAGIEVILESAQKIDTQAHEILLSNGRKLPYDKLLLGTGARPFIPPVEGRELEGVFSLRSLSDAEKIREYSDRTGARRFVFVGSGFISVELATLIKSSDPEKYEITVVELLDHPLPLMLDPELGDRAGEYLSDRGIRMLMGKKVVKITGDGTKATGVELDSGESLDADVVFLNVGARPDLELAEQAGIEIGKFGIKVNGFLETSDPDILAAGDCIEQKNFITGKPSAVQLRGPAVIQGRFVAKRLAGYDFEWPGILGNSAVKLFDRHIGATGLNESAATGEGYETVSATVDSRSRHGMIMGTKPWTLKLVFNKKNHELIGGQIMSDADAPVKEIDTVNALILGHSTAEDLSMLMCAGNPDISSEPSLEPITIAAEQALQKMK